MKIQFAIFRGLLVLACAFHLLGFRGLAQLQTTPTATEFSTLKAEEEKLRTKNKLLREENEGLQWLVKERDGAASVIAPTATPRTSGLRAPDAAGSQRISHWMTTSGGKRHNSSGWYYKNSNGRMCGPDEGSRARICGG